MQKHTRSCIDTDQCSARVRMRHALADRDSPALPPLTAALALKALIARAVPQSVCALTGPPALQAAFRSVNMYVMETGHVHSNFHVYVACRYERVNA